MPKTFEKVILAIPQHQHPKINEEALFAAFGVAEPHFIKEHIGSRYYGVGTMIIPDEVEVGNDGKFSYIRGPRGNAIAYFWTGERAAKQYHHLTHLEEYE